MSFRVAVPEGTKKSDDSSNIPRQPFMKGKKPLDVVIIGGSCAGLMAGILLKRQGHNIRILESARCNEREGMAAGVGLSAWVKKFFDEHDRLASIPIGVANDTMTVLDRKMKVQMTVHTGMRMTTWDAVYYRLKANFDGWKSDHCPDPPDLSEDSGTGVYEPGKRVLRVEGDEDNRNTPLQVFVEDAKTGETLTYEADIVIAADGANSRIRHQLMPQIDRHEPGYVLWRGTIPTRDLPQDVLDRLEGNTFMYRMPYSYAIIYTIPGASGSLLPGRREMNFAWYTWQTASTTAKILTDTQNHTHRSTLPKGGMNPTIWSSQLHAAEKNFHMHPQILTLLRSIRSPFASRITSHSLPRARYFHSRLFFVGDALAQKQPNTGLGVSMAVKNCMEFAERAAGRLGVEEWERGVLEDAERECVRSVAFAAWFLDGW